MLAAWSRPRERGNCATPAERALPARTHSVGGRLVVALFGGDGAARLSPDLVRAAKSRNMSQSCETWAPLGTNPPSWNMVPTMAAPAKALILVADDNAENRAVA